MPGKSLHSSDVKYDAAYTHACAGRGCWIFFPAAAGSGAGEQLREARGRMPSPSGPASHSRKGRRKAPGVL